MTREEKIAALADLITREMALRHQANYPNSPLPPPRATVKTMRRYAYIDIEDGASCSGRYMIDGEAIFGIKGYGVIHRGYRFGTLDSVHDFWWGDYRAVPYSKSLEDVKKNAERAAWRDFNNESGGFYNGPGTPFYLAEKARLSAIVNR